jgi:hypothetical protein
MRVRTLGTLVVAGLLWGFAAAANEPEAPEREGVTVEGALSEPADPDDAANIRADDDPQDVGQEALEPATGTPPVASPRPGGDSGRD